MTNIYDIDRKLDAISADLGEVKNAVSKSPDDFLNAEQAAAFLGVKLQIIYYYVQNNMIPAYRPTKRRIYFQKSDLVNFIKSRSDAR